MFEYAINTIPEVIAHMGSFNAGDSQGLKSIIYTGVPRKGKKTATFAYQGVPPIANEYDKVPGIVLVHGGLGHAFPQWVEQWMRYGYAAIAMDNTGYFPEDPIAADAKWHHGLPLGLSSDEYAEVPDNDGMNTPEADLDDQWVYHAISQAILAANLLSANPFVDETKIGVMGISWGGVVVSIVPGYFNRFAFAISVYAAGYLCEAYSWIREPFMSSRTVDLWAAERMFQDVLKPILWLTWNDDNCFSLNCASKSFLATMKNNPLTRISIRHEMMHSHEKAWACPEPKLFADMAIGEGPIMTSFMNDPVGRVINTLIAPQENTVVSAKLYYIQGKMSYSTRQRYGYESTFMDQEWHCLPLPIRYNCITSQVPVSAVEYYVELTTELPDGTSYAISSSLVYINGAD